MLKFALIWFILAFILGPLIGKFTKGNVHIVSDRECDEKIIKIEHVQVYNSENIQNSVRFCKKSNEDWLDKAS